MGRQPSRKETYSVDFSSFLEFARHLDEQDTLAPFREQFISNEPDLIYLDGNSLGRLPKSVIERMKVLGICF